MRVFLCEYVTSGGWRDRALPEQALPEALLLRDAILADLDGLPGIHPVLAYDDRLPEPGADAVPVRGGDDPWLCWSDLARGADVVWPVGPETAGLYPRMVRMMIESGARLIGPSAEAAALAASKLRTAEHLGAAGVPTAPTFPPDRVPSVLDGALVTKPETGAGGEDVRAWPDRSALPSAGAGLVVQPFMSGTPVSLTVLVRPDGAKLLTVNRIAVDHLLGLMTVTGVTVGGMRDESGALAMLARQVVAAIPGLSGLVDIEVMLTPDGPVVMEIHARATATYAGLHAALGINPAAFLPELIRSGRPPGMPHLPPPLPVEVPIR